MCGIVGYVGPADEAVLIRMRDALRHRGPDAADNFIDGEVSLGHRRLSIVDLVGGRQPVWNEDRSVVAIFNGEIYNYKRLRCELESLGHRFASDGDGETLVHAYESWGPASVARLDGMFAYVIYDISKRQLFGARDRLGKKPLYYTKRPIASDRGTIAFAFASEPKALREHPAIRRSLALSTDGLIGYLVNDYLPANQCIYSGLERLEPGSAFQFGLPGNEREGLAVWRYWDINLAPSDANQEAELSEQQAARDVLALLSEAVERRLMADVPLGAFLSGGIDSSTVVALMTRFRPASEIKTFSIAFDDPSYDESRCAADAAQVFGTTHFARTFSASDAEARLPGLIEALDEPFADPSVLPVSMLCEHAREQVTVALGGDGGDELFAGYDPLRAVGPAEAYRRLVPRWAHERLVVPALQLIPDTGANMSFGFRAARFLRGARLEPACRAPVWMGAFSMEQLARLTPDLGRQLDPERVYAPMLAAYRKLAGCGADPWSATLDFFERFYLPDDILVKIDRAGMMHSLEVRAPFLDTRLVEFVNRLSIRMKLRRGQSKYLLKRAVTACDGQTLVPPRIAHRRKKGFGIPVARWIKGELRSRFRRELMEEWPAGLDMFDKREIARLLDQHLSGAANLYKELWALFMLAGWSRRHF